MQTESDGTTIPSYAKEMNRRQTSSNWKPSNTEWPSFFKLIWCILIDSWFITLGLRLKQGSGSMIFDIISIARRVQSLQILAFKWGSPIFVSLFKASFGQ